MSDKQFSTTQVNILTGLRHRWLIRDKGVLIAGFITDLGFKPLGQMTFSASELRELADLVEELLKEEKE